MARSGRSFSDVPQSSGCNIGSKDSGKTAAPQGQTACGAGGGCELFTDRHHLVMKVEIELPLKN